MTRIARILPHRAPVREGMAVNLAEPGALSSNVSAPWRERLEKYPRVILAIAVAGLLVYEVRVRLFWTFHEARFVAGIEQPGNARDRRNQPTRAS